MFSFPRFLSWLHTLVSWRMISRLPDQQMERRWDEIGNYSTQIPCLSQKITSLCGENLNPSTLPLWLTYQAPRSSLVGRLIIPEIARLCWLLMWTIFHLFLSLRSIKQSECICNCKILSSEADVSLCMPHSPLCMQSVEANRNQGSYFIKTVDILLTS